MLVLQEWDSYRGSNDWFLFRKVSVWTNQVFPQSHCEGVAQPQEHRLGLLYPNPLQLQRALLA